MNKIKVKYEGERIVSVENTVDTIAGPGEVICPPYLEGNVKEGIDLANLEDYRVFNSKVVKRDQAEIQEIRGQKDLTESKDIKIKKVQKEYDRRLEALAGSSKDFTYIIAKALSIKHKKDEGKPERKAGDFTLLDTLEALMDSIEDLKDAKDSAIAEIEGLTKVSHVRAYDVNWPN